VTTNMKESAGERYYRTVLARNYTTDLDHRKHPNFI